LLQPARARRPRRTGEWTHAKAVTFIVTLAASRSVTLAAARAGVSRKSAYALKDRDPTFRAAWNAALSVVVDRRPPPIGGPRQGDEVGEIGNPASKGRQGYKDLCLRERSLDEQMRDPFFAAIANPSGPDRPAPLAPAAGLP
jgi:hypothetical protein